MPKPRPVILDHDGGHDDLVALALLLAHPECVRVIGCIVTDADCFVDHGFDVSGKLMALLHTTERTPLFPIARSTATAVHAFPTDWRWSAKNMEDLPCVNLPSSVAVWERQRPADLARRGEELLAELVLASEEKVTLCVTGPLTNVAHCLRAHGDAFASKIEACVIMGGAVDVGGNVFEPGADGSAEWNMYWDPAAAAAVLEYPILPRVLFSLDSTNSVPINSALVRRFGAQNEYLLSQFVGSAWASCTHHELMRPGDGYYAWDVLTAAYAIDPGCATGLAPVRLTVVTDPASASEGRTVRVAEEKEEGAPATLVATGTDAERFYNLVLDSMKRCRMSP